MSNDQSERAKQFALNTHSEAMADLIEDGIEPTPERVWELATYKLAACYIGLADTAGPGRLEVEPGRYDGMTDGETVH